MAEYSILIGQGRQSSEHSVLSASSAHRWLNCTASIKASEGMPDNVSDFAQTEQMFMSFVVIKQQNS